MIILHLKLSEFTKLKSYFFQIKQKHDLIYSFADVRYEKLSYNFINVFKSRV